MTENKKFGFTIAEVLIALIIVGVISALTLPSLLKDIFAKSYINTLTSTIENLQTAIQKELTEQRALSVRDTRVATDSQNFFEDHFGLANNNDRAFANEYKHYNNQTVKEDELPIPENRYMLKNGVGIGITNDFVVLIDVNGADKPNTVGRDVFVAYIEPDDMLNEGVHSGDVGISHNTNYTCEQARTLCRTGVNNTDACYAALALSGFKPNYLEKGCN